MSRQLRAALLKLRDQRLLEAYLQGKKSIAGDLVFPSETGTVLQPENLYHRYLLPILEHAGLRRIRLHDLRHFRVIANTAPRLSRLRQGADGPQFDPSDGRYLRSPDPRRRHQLCRSTGFADGPNPHQIRTRELCYPTDSAASC